MKITVLQNIKNANDQLAEKNLTVLNQNGVLAVNVMSSPGAGKTTLILETIRRLREKVKIGVIEADVASTIDADRIAHENVPVIQINTGGQCHIDANMVSNALEKLPLKDIKLLLVENVGNLICPADFKIGVQKNIMLLSVPEGDDKPFKYPLMFSTVDAVIVSKIDYLPLSDFNLEKFRQTVEGMNRKACIFPLSARTGEGFEAWVSWVESALKDFSGGKGSGGDQRKTD
jgi:hydrogenase nickel incorporation protein HypB